MEKRFLRDIEVSSIGTGCMGFSHGYGQIPERDYSVSAIRSAYDAGCTFFDTAESYGNVLYWAGHNEQILGEAVKDFRKNVVLATKFHFGKGNALQDEKEIETFMRRHLEQSMKNLQTDYIDLYYMHRYNPDMSIEKIAYVMGRFIDEGLIRGWGLSQINMTNLRKANAVTPLAAVQNLYNMVERDAERELFPYCIEQNIGVVPFSPTSSGLFAGNYTRESDFSHTDDVRKFIPQLKKENIDGNRPIIDLIEKFAMEKGCTNTQISLAWMLKKYPNAVPIPGSKNKDRILENLASRDVKFTDDEFRRLDDALCALPVYGHRGTVEYEGSKIEDWGKLK